MSICCCRTRHTSFDGIRRVLICRLVQTMPPLATSHYSLSFFLFNLHGACCIRPTKAPKGGPFPFKRPKLSRAGFTFYGKDGDECEQFIRFMRRKAFQAGRQGNYEWMAHYAATCFDKGALRWFERLDPNIQSNWNLVSQALLDEYPAVEPPEVSSRSVYTTHGVRLTTILVGISLFLFLPRRHSLFSVPQPITMVHWANPTHSLQVARRMSIPKMHRGEYI